MDIILNPGFLWFIAGLALLFIEFILPGIVIGFFGVGAILTGILYWLGILDNLTLQLSFFLVSSLALLFGLRRYLKKYFVGKVTGNENSSLSDSIGVKVPVVERIEKHSTKGRVLYEGTEWNAIADEDIEKGTLVITTKKENLTFTVKKID